jgi:hypothetical protein
MDFNRECMMRAESRSRTFALYLSDIIISETVSLKTGAGVAAAERRLGSRQPSAGIFPSKICPRSFSLGFVDSGVQSNAKIHARAWARDNWPENYV